MKTIRSLFLTVAVLVSAPLARSETVTAWFSGTIADVYSPSNAVPSGITVGTPFQGRVFWDEAGYDWSTTNHYAVGSTANYYFTDPTALAFLIQVGGHTITNAACTWGGYAGSFHVYDDYQNFDEFPISSANANLIMDGQALAGESETASILLDLRDASTNVITNTEAPNSAAALNQFQKRRYFALAVRVNDGSGNQIFSVSGPIDSFSTGEQIGLNQRIEADGSIRLSWPSIIEGYSLVSSPSASGDSWTPVPQPETVSGMERVVVVPSNSTNRFFRLKK